MTLLPTVMLFVVVAAILLLFFLTFRRKNSGKKREKKDKLHSRDRNAILKESNKRLLQNPKDPDALLALGNLHYREDNYEKAMRLFSVLIDLCATNPIINEQDVTTKYALCALKLNDFKEAYKGLLIARSLSPDIFEVNFNLGILEFKRKNYEKAVQLLKQAYSQQAEHVQTLHYYGQSLYKMRGYKEAVSILKKALELEPEDKESLFVLAQCYFELGQNDKAIKIFTHLRPDPDLGPHSTLFSGTIHMNNHQYQKAIMDFSIGLRHKNIKPEILLELKYRLATAHLKQQEIGRAIGLLLEIQDMYPGYKDVESLVQKYAELNSSKNLQVYLMAPTSEYLTLCRKIANNYFPQAKVKITDIFVQKTEYADILAEVHTAKWEDLVLFRFIRTTGNVGELLLRDLHTRIKELKAGRGFCLSAGVYSEGAHQFVEARLIDLIEKEGLMKILHEIDSSQSVA